MGGKNKIKYKKMESFLIHLCDDVELDCIWRASEVRLSIGCWREPKISYNNNNNNRKK